MTKQGLKKMKITAHGWQSGFYTKSGAFVTYRSLALRCKKEFPELEGKHIFEQLDALGVRLAFNQGTTPDPVPLTLDYNTN
jgi:hypothetical protein